MAALVNGLAQFVFAQPTATSTGTTTTGITTISGQLLVAFVSCFTNKIGTTPVSDNKGNTWSAASAAFGTTNGFGAMYYVPNCTGGASHTFTFTPTGSDFIAIVVVALSGMALTSPFSNTNKSSALTTSHNSGTITTAGTADECFLGAATLSHVNEWTTFAQGGRWPLVLLLPGTASSQGLVLVYRPAASGTTDAFAWTGSNFNEATMIAGFKVADAAPAGNVPFYGSLV